MEIITLHNGMRLVLDARPHLRSCAVGLFVACGSRFETPQTLGVSHCIEHMLFKGTQTRTARQIAEIADDTGGTLNAYTSKEYTCVYARVLREQMPTILAVIADMALRPALRAEDLETEKGVIAEERNSYEDSSEDLCMDSYYESLWPEDMLGKNIVGTPQTIQDFTPDKLRAQMETFYVPERMVISFSGAFDRNEAIALCERHFGDLQNTGNPLTYTSPQPTRFVRTVRKSFQQNMITLGFPACALESEQVHAATYACAVLGGSGSSQLFQRLREELGLVYSVDAYLAAFLGAGTACISMGLAVEKEESAIRETLQLCRAFPASITERELDRAKMQTLSAVAMSLESPSTSASRIGRNLLLRGEVLEEDALLQKLQSVTLEEVREAATQILQPDRLSLCVVGKTRAQKTYKSILNEYRG